MKLLILTLTACLFVLTFQSCANHKPVEVEAEEPKEQLDKLVARVSSVNRSAEYVLIQRYGRLVIPEDSIVYTLNDSTTENQASSLKITGEKLGQFIAADIVSGNPVVGDAVYLRNLEKKSVKTTLQPLEINHPGSPQVKPSEIIQLQPSEQAPQNVIDHSPKLKENDPIFPIQPGDNLLPIVN